MIAAPRSAASHFSGAALLAAAVVLTATVGPAFASPPPARAVSHRAAAPLRSNVLDAARHSDVNRMNMFTTNFGSFAWDIGGPGSPPGLIWPRGTNQTAVFASGLWLGCSVGSETRVVVSEYSFEYGPGGMVGGTFDDPNRPEHHVYKVARWTGNPDDSARVDRTPAELAADPLLDPLAHHAWSEYIAGARPYGAPTRIYRLPDTSTPQPDDSVDVEGPDVLGDQMLWEVHNDADPARHTNDAGASTPLGVEIRQTTFAFDRSDGLGDILFLKFDIRNKGANTLDDLYVSLWSDPDLGGASDDLVGCDTTRALGFAYNATGNDPIYGSPPPAVGYVLLRGAINPATGMPMGLTAFNKYISGTDPASFAQTYYYMHGLLGDGSPVIDPTTNQPTRYFHPGDPVTAQGWLDSNPSDRRMMLTSGPARMLPGQTQEVWAAIVVGRGADRLTSVSAVRCLADLARSAYEQNFAPLPSPASTCSGGSVIVNCPKPAVFWGLECAAAGTGQLTSQQLTQTAAFVNGQATLFDWPVNALGQFCGTVSPPGSPDLRQRARSEFSTFLANYSGSLIDLSIGGGRRIGLHPGTGISCPPLRARTLAELASTTLFTPKSLAAAYLNNNEAHRQAFAGVNAGLESFDGGAGLGDSFFGSTVTLPDSINAFTTVEIRFDRTATQKAHRYLRLQQAGGSSPAFGRYYPYAGFHDVPFQAWDAINNVQLEVAFVEKGFTDAGGTLLPSSQQPATFDSTWALDPNDLALGGREYLFVLNRPYAGIPRPELMVDNTIQNGGFPLLYALWAHLGAVSDMIDDGDAFQFQWVKPASPGADSLLVELEGRSLADPSVQVAYQGLIDCLSQINAGIGIGPTCDSDPTPTLVSLVNAEASVDRVLLRWYSAEPGIVASVERRAEGEDWATLGSVAPDGGGLLIFEDLNVAAGARYDYRLAVESGGQVEYAGQTRVEVPSRAVLAFLGTRPNPGDGRLLVAFSLATREPAMIEVLDVAGRRLLVRDLTGLGPGSHALALDERPRFPAGIYLVRITQGARRVSGKAAIVR